MVLYFLFPFFSFPFTETIRDAMRGESPLRQREDTLLLVGILPLLFDWCGILFHALPGERASRGAYIRR